jgi:Fic family protein
VSYTEKKERGNSTYYYRTHSHRDNGSVKKKRKYLGKDLDEEQLKKLEIEADRELLILEGLLKEDEIVALEKLKKEYSNVPKGTFQNRYETFTSRFTHDSTAIEGNTLTLQETAGLLFDKIAPSSKELRELNEVINHREAFDHILSHEGDITRKFILDIHRILMKGTLNEELEDQIGMYRSVQVFIRAVEWMPPSPEDVPTDMKELLRWYTVNKGKVHPLVLASYFHVGFETIHPFVDGNGRVGRLLLNFILHKNGYPMVNIPNSRKLEYYQCLERSQTEGDLRSFVQFIFGLITTSDLLF